MPPKDVGEKYKQHDLRSHIYELPDTYVGSAESTTIDTFVYDDDTKHMVRRPITYVPALYKLLDEGVVNALDQAVRLKAEAASGREDVRFVREIRISADRATGAISIYNSGNGIECVRHPSLGVYVAEMIFGMLLTSANYDQNEERVTGGRNGAGVKLVNIFSEQFDLETVDHYEGKIYRQRWHSNMKVREDPVIKSTTKAPYTRITFTPDYARFGLSGMTEDFFQMIRKRAMDAAACTDATVSVYFNDEKIPCKSFESYVDLFLGPKTEHPRVYEACNDRWEVVATYSDGGSFEQVSFVNGINTLRGGRHVDHITGQIVKGIQELVAKKKKKEVKAQLIRDNLMVFVKATIVNPAFDSQTKETFTSPVAKWGSKCELSQAFIDKLYKTDLTEKVVSISEFHDKKKLAKTDGKKTNRIFIPKLEDAHYAGTKNSAEATLILTEGDSAKSMAVSGLSVIGRERYGVFPLRGKILSVKDTPTAKIGANEEIAALKKIIGLEQGKVYQDLSSLRYGRIMLLADSDVDGSHIRGLIMSLFQTLWPSLFHKSGFLVSMLTPIVKANHRARGETLSFYNLPDFYRWQRETDQRGWTLKYYKGLGTSTSEEAKEYFRQMKLLTYEYTGKESDEAIDLAFSKKRADDRKAWLMQFNADRTLDYNKGKIPYEDFIHEELIHFSNADIERSIPNIMDGLKVSLRKILFTCFKRKLWTNEIRVAQLAGSVSEVSAYHHGEASLQGAIISMAQTFVGANNAPLLAANGQFGGRLQGGNDAASPRYIHTLLTPIARALFVLEDEAVLRFQDDDGLPVEPTWYAPVVPLVLLNGIIGIGTGFSTTIPAFHPAEVVAQCRMIADAVEHSVGDVDSDDTAARAYDAIVGTRLAQLRPFYLGFQGRVLSNGDTGFSSHGVYQWIDDQTVEITELPLFVWTDDYKAFLEETIQAGSTVLKDYANFSTEKTVRFVLKLYPGARAKAEKDFEKAFKLVSTKNLSVNNMHLYTAEGTIKKYVSTEEIIQDWALVRIAKYRERKAHQIREMEHEHKILSAKVRFIQEVIAKVIVVNNAKKSELEEVLRKREYPRMRESGPEDAPAAPGTGAGSESDPYGYLLRMPIYQLTYERKIALEKEADNLFTTIQALRAKTVSQIWREDLARFEEAWDAHSAQVLAEMESDRTGRPMPGNGTRKRAPAPRKKQ